MVPVVVTGHSSRRSTPPRWTPTGNGHQRGQFCWPPLGRTVGRQRAATWPPLGRISWPPTVLMWRSMRELRAAAAVPFELGCVRGIDQQTPAVTWRCCLAEDTRWALASGGLGGCEGEGGAGEPAAHAGGCGEEPRPGKSPVAPTVGVALLEAELDTTVGEFARHDPDLSGGKVERRAGEPAIHAGGCGEEPHAGKSSVAPTVGVALLEAELDTTVTAFARHDPHRRSGVGGF